VTNKKRYRVRYQQLSKLIDIHLGLGQTLLAAGIASPFLVNNLELINSLKSIITGLFLIIMGLQLVKLKVSYDNR
jgi:hypothetical protein